MAEAGSKAGAHEVMLRAAGCPRMPPQDGSSGLANGGAEAVWLGSGLSQAPPHSGQDLE